jgi:hypothetical protein
MSADQFLPAFILICSKCAVRRLGTTVAFIRALSGGSALVGHRGYLLSMLEAAVEYIACFGTDKLRRSSAISYQ